MNWVALPAGTIIKHKDGTIGVVINPWACDSDHVHVFTNLCIKSWSISDIERVVNESR